MWVDLSFPVNLDALGFTESVGFHSSWESGCSYNNTGSHCWALAVRLHFIILFYFFSLYMSCMCMCIKKKNMGFTVKKTTQRTTCILTFIHLSPKININFHFDSRQQTTVILATSVALWSTEITFSCQINIAVAISKIYFPSSWLQNCGGF